MSTPVSERRSSFAWLRTPSRKSLSLTGVVAAALMSGPALAQPVGSTPERSEWLSLVVAVLLVALVCVGAFMGSKRGHLD